MASRYEFKLATHDEDAALRHILASTPMKGDVALTFRREPNYFEAAVVDGGFRQVIYCRERDSHAPVGFGCRSVRQRFVNGRPLPIGYLSGLRTLPRYKRLGLLARGYAFLRTLDEDRRAVAYLTTIGADNVEALQSITQARGGLPHYFRLGYLHTYVIPIRQRSVRAPGVYFRQATRADLPRLVSFWHRVGAAKQFFPCYQPSEFFQAGGSFRDLEPSDLFLALRDDQLVGTLGLWNQTSFRQTVVESYSGKLRWARGAYNIWAMFRGRVQLPPPGTSLRILTAAVPVVESESTELFRPLLQFAMNRVRQLSGPSRKFRHLVLGLSEGDPLSTTARSIATHVYSTILFLVSWQAECLQNLELDQRPAYLELGAL